MTDYQSSRLNRKLGLEPPLPTKKERKAIPKVSAKKKAKDAAEKEYRNGGETEKQKWFRQQVKMMPEFCEETGLRLERHAFKYAVCSVAHILSQQQCPSVALHPANRVFLEPGFHKKFDAMSWEEKEQLGCWPKIKDRLISIWEDLAHDERRHFPDSVRNFIENQEPFK